MRLLHTEKFELEEFGGNEVPHYAILSHTWGKEEVTLQDIKTNESMDLNGYKKVQKACFIAAADGFKYIWIDTCCIDKTSSAELSEAINSMYRWYQEADVCYAYLADVPSKSEFSNSRWFTRGWTLQELIAPFKVIFLDEEWKELGSKTRLRQSVSDRTGIPIAILSGDDDPEKASIAQRMSWAANRETSRLEDRAYCLMGIFGINMPLLYGEGKTAFIRLQEEIIKVSDDHSIFAWRSEDQNNGGLLATSPDAFKESADIILRHSLPITSNSPWTVSNKGIHLELSFIGICPRELGLAILPCTRLGKEDLLLGIFLRDVSLTMERFERVWCGKFKLVSLRRFRRHQYPIRQICVRQRLLAIARTPKDHQEYSLNSVKTKEHGFAPEIALPDSNWELFNGRLTNFADVTEPTSLLPTPLKGGDNLADEDPRTLLSHAVGGRRVEEVRSLLARRIIPADLKDNNERTLLSHAAGAGNEKVVWLLLDQRNVIADSKDKDKRTPLSYAADGGHEDVVWLLLARSDIKPDIGDISGLTPLSYAATSGHEAVIKMLLKSGANVESKDLAGWTPLWWAAKNGHEAVVQLLLNNGADVEPKVQYNQTPLSWAAENGHEAVVQLLLNNSANIESKDQDSRTPLLWAAKNGHEAVVQLLLNNNANIESKDRYGQTPLSRAAENGYKAIVQLLLNNGANIESKDQSDQTPLSWATKNGYKAVVQLLLNNGANIESKDRYGWTPLSLATRNKHEAITQLLLNNSANIESKDIL
ncbi:related to beta transducin-like protein [Phialocephala subalpina]|uniref:Related to beta transducin-like protein n=1 Tax=Phialocephala subalpina TaxID=576137 RepID=A0A1L7WF73_9HELO|nr:related to beta transducin-like protein [Phialocephala subalpina]